MSNNLAVKCLWFFIGFIAITAFGWAVSPSFKDESLKVNVTEYASSDKVTVKLDGEVKNPGSYTLPRGTPMHELLYMAGGLTADGDISSVDYDGIVTESGSITVTAKTNSKTDVISELKYEFEEVRCNINTASESELSQLNGIGESKAAAIINYRETNGPFSSTKDLLKVKGIGQKTYDKIKDLITVGG